MLDKCLVLTLLLVVPFLATDVLAQSNGVTNKFADPPKFHIEHDGIVFTLDTFDVKTTFNVTLGSHTAYVESTNTFKVMPKVSDEYKIKIDAYHDTTLLDSHTGHYVFAPLTIFGKSNERFSSSTNPALYIDSDSPSAPDYYAKFALNGKSRITNDENMIIGDIVLAANSRANTQARIVTDMSDGLSSGACTSGLLRTIDSKDSPDDYEMPSNVAGNSFALGFVFSDYISTDYENNTKSCTADLNSFSKPIEFAPALRIILYDQSGKEAFTFSPRESKNNAIPMPKCNSNTFFFPSHRLIGDIDACYYDDGTNIVIFTKKLEYYGVTSSFLDDVKPPTNTHKQSIDATECNSTQCQVPYRFVNGNKLIGGTDRGFVYMANNMIIYPNSLFTGNHSKECKLEASFKNTTEAQDMADNAIGFTFKPKSCSSSTLSSQQFESTRSLLVTLPGKTGTEYVYSFSPREDQLKPMPISLCYAFTIDKYPGLFFRTRLGLKDLPKGTTFLDNLG